MLQELLNEREKMRHMYEKMYGCGSDTREKILQMIKSFDQNVFSQFMNSKEVNEKLLEELQFYTK